MNVNSVVNQQMTSCGQAANVSFCTQSDVTLQEFQKESAAKLVGECIHQHFCEWKKTLFGIPEKKSQIISKKGQVHPFPHTKPAKLGILSSVMDNLQQTAISIQRVASNSLRPVESCYQDS